MKRKALPDYDVGKGKPPVEYQFRPGQSGNPSGRPKGTRSFSTILRQSLNELTTVRQNGQQRQLTNLQAIIEKLVEDALNGDARARDMLLKYASEVRVAVPSQISDLLDSTSLSDEAFE